MLQTRRPELRTVLISVTDGYSTDDVESNLNRIKTLPNMLLFAAAVNKLNN